MNEGEIRFEIDEALRRYCRGIDRLNGELVASAFHPGAELIDYGADVLSIEVFAEYAVASLAKRFAATQHRLSNTTIAIDGSTALVESYVLAHHLERDGETERLHTFNGRYIDRFEERDGAWKIARRTLRTDWSRVETIDTPMGGTWVASGRGGSPDPLDDA